MSATYVPPLKSLQMRELSGLNCLKKTLTCHQSATNLPVACHKIRTLCKEKEKEKLREKEKEKERERTLKNVNHSQKSLAKQCVNGVN